MLRRRRVFTFVASGGDIDFCFLEEVEFRFDLLWKTC
jgi:hypothetical protein